MLIVMIMKKLVCLVSPAKLFDEVANARVSMVNDREEHSLLFKLQTLFTGLTRKAVSMAMIFFICDH